MMFKAAWAVNGWANDVLKLFGVMMVLNVDWDMDSGREPRIVGVRFARRPKWPALKDFVVPGDPQYEVGYAGPDKPC